MLRKRSFVTSAAIKNPLGVVVVVVVVVVVIAGRQGALREEQTDAPSWLGQPKELILCAGLPIAVANLLIGASFQTGTCHTNFRCPLSIAPKRHRAGGPHSLPPLSPPQIKVLAALLFGSPPMAPNSHLLIIIVNSLGLRLCAAGKSLAVSLAARG